LVRCPQPRGSAVSNGCPQKRDCAGTGHTDAAARLARSARHFDNLVWELSVPEFDRRQALHRELADCAAEAERVAAVVPLREGAHFMRQRRAIRDALAENGIAAMIDALVAHLLDR
jgi:hypothetical protein